MSQPHIENLISEEEFIPILNTVTGDFFRLVNLVTSKPTKTWAKSYYSNLSEKAHALESHLDEYHARYNKKFSYFTCIGLRNTQEDFGNYNGCLSYTPIWRVHAKDGTHFDYYMAGSPRFGGGVVVTS